jgi:hypothetical protein
MRPDPENDAHVKITFDEIITRGAMEEDPTGGKMPDFS